MPGVTKEQIQAAREADLFAWLQSHEPGVLKRDGPNYRHKEHDSLVYVTGKRYWYWNSRGRSINALDYLIQIRGYVWWMRFKHWQAEKYGRRRLTKARRQSRHRESRKRNRLRCPGPDGVLPPLFRICSGAGSVRM